MERLKSTYFSVGIIMECIALVYFIVNQEYTLPAFIVVKWVISLFYFLIASLTAGVSTPK